MCCVDRPCKMDVHGQSGAVSLGQETNLGQRPPKHMASPAANRERDLDARGRITKKLRNIMENRRDVRKHDNQSGPRG